MDEGLYEPLPSVEAYLARIGIDGAKEPTLDFLDELVYAHQCSVPFEDLDICEKHAEISLDIAALFGKIVTRRRGGYCFEQNALFASLLRALGFEVQAGFARVLTAPTNHPAISHRVSVVRLGDALHMADVGFGGPMPGFAIKLEDGFSRKEHGQLFTVRAHSEHWWDICYMNAAGEETPELRACTLPAEESDFVSLSYHLSQFPESWFRIMRLANIRTPRGARSITGMTYTEHEDGAETVRELADEAELDAVLAEKFGIVDWR